jgi:hypothetical protein
MKSSESFRPNFARVKHPICALPRVRYYAAVKTLIAILSLAYPHLAFTQGTFENLDFESANLSSEPPQQFPSLVPIDAALPGWTVYLGPVQQTEVNYNYTTIGTANVAVLGATWSSTDPGVIDGNYSVLLQSGGVPNTSLLGNASIEQTGTIPANAESIEFKAWGAPSPSDIGVSFAGNSLTPLLLYSGPTFNTYGVNISPYSGQTGSLEFSALFTSQNATLVDLDDISFSPTAIVPEPTPLALAGIGTVLFALYRRLGPRKIEE